MKKSPKNPQKYTCVHCKYSTSNTKDYNKHLLTTKHLNRTLRTEKSQISPEIPKSKFVCVCGKEYTARNSLWYHRKTCKGQMIESEKIQHESCNVVDENETDIILSDTNKISPGFIMELLRQKTPECIDSDHLKYNFCIKMMRNMLGDVGLEQKRLDNKIIKNLSKHLLVEK